MAINVNNNLLNPAGTRSSESNERRGDAVAPPKADQAQTSQASTTRTDSVNLSAEGKSLRQIEEKLASQPDIDQDKVARVKQAIADGSYQVDARKLAENLYSLETQLNKP
ncbi:flagellar biosynthesis anti-sigma factor FlgM [Aestuariirhabdus sp. Z084]|uniref:flagellar biosynthesis anti-sigma factor FlgM n=1 Tax=Aestuariirhabdus haliotis TaxID=2918751 RepID=UPI00201B432F|nr:flagellar biosynthesis anti-sigma factor FlgM [Aestuariirhabdus haliotis]MCL6414436.1 flagellar biosynthesis anti-sigma factor FlgM [Aestuariirhabdus haliotis]MCL6418582.1 flagellar biosynthesis anti-sigma factor FlgM [Aestuariirhabdus haliotis]